MSFHEVCWSCGHVAHWGLCNSNDGCTAIPHEKSADLEAEAFALRDQIAVAVLPALIEMSIRAQLDGSGIDFSPTDPNLYGIQLMYRRNLAQSSYQWADVLLEARAKATLELPKEIK